MCACVLQVYYNNLLSLVPIAVLMLGFGELHKLPHEPALANPEFLTVAMLGGLLGFGISFTSLWYMSRSTATVYSLTVRVCAAAMGQHRLWLLVSAAAAVIDLTLTTIAHDCRAP